MKEPSREKWGEDFLSEAHDALNKAAVARVLCHRGNEARLLIGGVLTLAGKSTGTSALGQWPEGAIEKVREAQALLAQANPSPEAHRAQLHCADAVRLLDEGGKLRPEFKSKSEDREAALRFFGNARVAHEGRGHGVQLDRPLRAGGPDGSRHASGPGNDRPGDDAREAKKERSWTRREDQRGRSRRRAQPDDGDDGPLKRRMRKGRGYGHRR